MVRKKLNLDAGKYDINEENLINDFVLDNHLKDALLKLENYQDIHVTKISAKYEDSVWRFRDKTLNKVYTFNFSLIENLIKFSKHKDKKAFIDALKCWMIENISEQAISNAATYFSNIYSACFATQFFSESSREGFLNQLHDRNVHRIAFDGSFEIKECDNYALTKYIITSISFLNYYNSREFSRYIKGLVHLKEIITVSNEGRQLPSYKNVAKFKVYLEDWYEQTSEDLHKQSELIRFMPILLWWEITSIIPLRGGEFCSIRRDCLSKNHFSLTFPRNKQHRKGANRLQDIYDTLPIPEKIYKKISLYIDLTGGVGSYEFLFPFEIFREHNRISTKIDYDKETVFSQTYLRELLARFYKEIIHDRYKVNILEIKGSYLKILSYYCDNSGRLIVPNSKDYINCLIKVGDLRHIAIINMMLQGYDAAEIKRLAGHLVEETQYGYQNHMQFWVDTHIYHLASEFATASVFNIANREATSHNKLINSKAINEYRKLQKQLAFVEDIEEIPENSKLFIGYCNDAIMPCNSFNRGHKGCYFCKHWRISISELNGKRELILQDLSKTYDEIQSKVSFLKALYKSQLESMENLAIDDSRAIQTTASELQLQISNAAKLMYMIGATEHE